MSYRVTGVWGLTTSPDCCFGRKAVRGFSRCHTTRKVRPLLLRLQDRRLPPPGQILERAGLEQRLVELTALKIAQL